MAGAERAARKLVKNITYYQNIFNESILTLQAADVNIVLTKKSKRERGFQ